MSLTAGCSHSFIFLAGDDKSYASAILNLPLSIALKLKDFSSTKFLGSNKKQVFTYEITIKNNKKESTLMLLKDQYPLSFNNDIEVELMESSDAANNTELGVITGNFN